MKKETKEKHFAKKPIYPGGKAAMKAYIQENLQYPEDAVKNSIEGIVRVWYTIDKNGKVTKTKLIKKIGYGCDEEAIRLVKGFKFHVPKNHMKIKFNKHANIRFKLPKKQVVQFVYKQEAPKKADNSYSYTINL